MSIYSVITCFRTTSAVKSGVSLWQSGEPERKDHVTVEKLFFHRTLQLSMKYRMAVYTAVKPQIESVRNKSIVFLQSHSTSQSTSDPFTNNLRKKKCTHTHTRCFRNTTECEIICVTCFRYIYHKIDIDTSRCQTVMLR